MAGISSCSQLPLRLESHGQLTAKLPSPKGTHNRSGSNATLIIKGAFHLKPNLLGPRCHSLRAKFLRLSPLRSSTSSSLQRDCGHQHTMASVMSANGSTARRPMTIGVFDSGVGGLSVVAALQKLMPSVTVRYIADTDFFPYGDKSTEDVRGRAILLARHLEDEGCDLLIVACNTASSIALEHMRESVRIPVVGMEPPVKPAVALSRSRHVVVLVTQRTADGDRLANLRRSHANGAKVAVVPMPGLADLIEAGEIDGPKVSAVLRRAIDGHLLDGADVIALGCTHYGFIKASLEAMLSHQGVQVVDAAVPVARHALRLLGFHVPNDAHKHPHEAKGHAETKGHAEPKGHAAAGAGELELADVLFSVTGCPTSMQRTLDALRAAGADLPVRIKDLGRCPTGGDAAAGVATRAEKGHGDAVHPAACGCADVGKMGA